MNVWKRSLMHWRNKLYELLIRPYHVIFITVEYSCVFKWSRNSCKHCRLNWLFTLALFIVRIDIIQRNKIMDSLIREMANILMKMIDIKMRNEVYSFRGYKIQLFIFLRILSVLMNWSTSFYILIWLHWSSSKLPIKISLANSHLLFPDIFRFRNYSCSPVSIKGTLIQLIYCRNIFIFVTFLLKKIKMLRHVMLPFFLVFKSDTPCIIKFFPISIIPGHNLHFHNIFSFVLCPFLWKRGYGNIIDIKCMLNVDKIIMNF